ncbi:MAG: PrgI family protein [Ruminococcus sp.]|nr:PrgI family protein [Ruminococcus sp.]
MKIDMNKDFEQEFEATVIKGMTGREVLFGGLAFVLAALLVIVIWRVTDLPINICVYLGIPVMVPVTALGILKYQGATMMELFRDIRYYWRTRCLAYEAEERAGEDRIFSMIKHEYHKKKERKKHGGI